MRIKVGRYKPCIFQPLFSFQVCRDLECNQDSPSSPGKTLHPLTCSSFLFFWEVFLLVLSFLFGSHLQCEAHCFYSYFWSNPLIFAKAQLTLTLTLSHLMLWTNSSIIFSFGNSDCDVFSNCSLCDPEATFCYLANPM